MNNAQNNKVSIGIGVNFDINKAITDALNWFFSKQRTHYTFKEYFRKIKATHLSEDRKREVLEELNNKELKDSRRVIVDWDKKNITFTKLY
ncbi:MAG: hypothetical protein AABW88_02865 [Nanoarchaeota archaeon]